MAYVPYLLGYVRWVRWLMHQTSVHMSCTYVRPKYCVRHFYYTAWWILFIPIHSDQLDMKMIVKTGFWDAASFTWVMGLCPVFTICIKGGKSCVAQLLLHPLMYCVHTHTQWSEHDMEMTVKIGLCDAASFTWVMGLCTFISKFIIINIRCPQPCATISFYLYLFPLLFAFHNLNMYNLNLNHNLF